MRAADAVLQNLRPTKSRALGKEMRPITVSMNIIRYIIHCDGDVGVNRSLSK